MKAVCDNCHNVGESKKFLDSIKIGDKIMLDEEFMVIDIE